MQFEESFVSSIFEPDEFETAKETIKSVCEKNPAVLGVLITGSLTQKIRVPSPQDYTPRNAYEAAYSLILNRSRRRLYPRTTSDLDVWVCTVDPENADNIRRTLQQRAINLVDWLSRNIDRHGTDWIQQKKEAFNPFYKQHYMYPNEWLVEQPNYPWRASALKREIITALGQEIPHFIERVNHNFEKKIPGDFLEVRAYPTCTFNLRPEEIMVAGQIDKTPFPFIVDEWLDLQRNCFVLYAAEQGLEQMIYPFNEKGEHLGTDLLRFIQEP